MFGAQPSPRHVGPFLGLLALFAMPTLEAAVCGEDAPAHPCLGAPEAQGACFAVVQEDPRSLAPRLALCEALLREGDLVTAAIIVHEGITRCATPTCRDSLVAAEQRLQQTRAARDQADPLAAERAVAAARRRCTSGLSGDRSVASCEELLLDKPDDLALYDALARKLLKRGEPVRAFDYVLQARAVAADAQALPELFAQASARRGVLVEDCLAGDSLALCHGVYVAGAADEGQVLHKTGTLLLAQGQRQAGREALSAAQRLLPEDPLIAKALAALDRPAPKRKPKPTVAAPRPPEAIAERGSPEQLALAFAPPEAAGVLESVRPRNAGDADGRVH